MRKEKLKYIPPLFIIIASVVCIILRLGVYYTATEDISTTYMYPEESAVSVSEDAEGTSGGVKYQLDESEKPEDSDIERVGGESSDTAELEELIEDINKQAEKATIIDP